jgi:hypothetical protein
MANVEVERHYLLKHHPLLCGSLAFGITLELHQVGITLCNTWGTITYSAHFYNAVHQRNLSQARWPLMDQAMAMHPEAFLGERPKSPLDCFKQTNLVLGNSVQTFAKNRRSKEVLLSKNGPRGLKDPSELGRGFKVGISETHGAGFNLHRVEEVLKPASSNRRTPPQSPLQLLRTLRLALPVSFVFHSRPLYHKIGVESQRYRCVTACNTPTIQR